MRVARDQPIPRIADEREFEQGIIRRRRQTALHFIRRRVLAELQRAIHSADSVQRAQPGQTPAQAAVWWHAGKREQRLLNTRAGGFLDVDENEAG